VFVDRPRSWRPELQFDEEFNDMIMRPAPACSLRQVIQADLKNVTTGSHEQYRIRQKRPGGPLGNNAALHTQNGLLVSSWDIVYQTPFWRLWHLTLQTVAQGSLKR